MVGLDDLESRRTEEKIILVDYEEAITQVKRERRRCIFKSLGKHVHCTKLNAKSNWHTKDFMMQ